MSKFLNKIFLCAALCLISGIANAGDGFYIAGQGGYSWLKTPKIRDHKTTGSPLQDHTTGDYAWGLNAGYEEKIYGNLSGGVELGYNNDGHSTITYASGNRYNISSFDVDLLATTKYKIGGSPYYIGAKAGVAAVQQRYKIAKNISNATPDPTTSTYKYEPVLALISGYSLNDKVDFYIGYKHIFARNLDSTAKAFGKDGATSSSVDIYRGIATVDNVNIGVAYHF